MKEKNGENKYKTWLGLSIFFLIFYTFSMLLRNEPLDFGFYKCFLTPNLFSREGVSLLKGFLFELPIASARWLADTGMLLLVVICFSLAVISYFKSREDG